MSAPRIAPGTRADIGLINMLLARVIGAATGGGPPNVFTTLARHRSFRAWLRFAGKLMPGGRLPRVDSELVILRVAHLTGSAYEWDQHVRLGRAAGLSAEEVERVRSGPAAAFWTPRQVLLLSACDALHADQDIGDDLWAQLAAEFTDEDLIELCLLVGHYVMLAGMLNALRVESDAAAGSPPAVIRLAEKVLRR